MKRLHKFFSVLLCLAMLIGWLPVVAYAADGDSTYKLVTDAKDLKAGNKIVIVAANSDFALSTTQNKNNRGQAAVTKNTDGTITVDETNNANVQVITLVEGTKTGTFAFYTGPDGYLCAASSSSNNLKTQTTKDDNGSWKIEIKDGVTTVTAQGTNTRNLLKYNSTSSLFSCYGKTNDQKDICIYKLDTSTSGGGGTSDCTHADTDKKWEKVDESTHREMCCDCKNPTGTTAPHADNGFVSIGKDGHKKWCEVCQSNYGEIEAHNLVDGKCTKCSYVDLPTATLVTDVSTLKAGDKIIIVNADGTVALSTTQNDNNRGQAKVTKTDKTVTFGTDVQVLTLEAGTVNGTFAFKTDDGYLYAASSSKNYLKTQTTNNDNGFWKIEITNTTTGVATVKAQGTYTHNLLKYNSSSSIFSCYTGGQGDICIYKVNEKVNEATELPEFSSASLVLSGEIGVNFYMNIPAYAQSGKMQFTVSGKNGKTTEINCADAVVVDGQYKFTCYVNAIQMADTITATYCYGDGNAETVVQTYSVQKYINAVAESDQPATVKALAAALANYGYYTQQWLSGVNGFSIGEDHAAIASSGALGDNNPDLSAYKCAITGKIDGVEVSGALSLDAKTSIYLYFTVADTYKDGLTVTVNGEAATVEQINGQYRVVISGISAHRLGEAYTVVVNGTMTVTVSALSYANAVLSAGDTTDAAKNAMTALYAYYEATVAYKNTLTNQ